MWETIINELRELAVTVLVAILSLGAAYALTYIRRAKEAMDQRIDNELADRALASTFLGVILSILITLAVK